MIWHRRDTQKCPAAESKFKNFDVVLTRESKIKIEFKNKEIRNQPWAGDHDVTVPYSGERVEDEVQRLDCLHGGQLDRHPHRHSGHSVGRGAWRNRLLI